MALDDLLTPWAGTAYRHLPAASPFSALDFRFAGRSKENRWNEQGEPTLYLASDVGVAIAEFGRHFQVSRTPIGTDDVVRRLVYRLDLQIDHLLDLRDPRLHAALSLSDVPVCFLDRTVARAVAQYVRRMTAAQALIVPSVAMLDRPDCWNLVLFLEKLPAEPPRYITQVAIEGPLQWGESRSPLP